MTGTAPRTSSPHAYKLPDHDRERIVAEEIFRDEVRRHLAEGSAGRNNPGTRWAQALGSPLGIWFLSTIVLGLFTWTFSGLQARHNAQQHLRELTHRLDGEASGRIQQWLRMCDIGWNRDTFTGSEFHHWYFELVKAPAARPDYMYAVYPIYAEFADRPLVSVLTQLREAVSAEEQPEVAQAAEWVGTWNPDVFEGKSYDEQVALVRTHLWLRRWGELRLPPPQPAALQDKAG